MDTDPVTPARLEGTDVSICPSSWVPPRDWEAKAERAKRALLEEAGRADHGLPHWLVSCCSWESPSRTQEAASTVTGATQGWSSHFCSHFSSPCGESRFSPRLSREAGCPIDFGWRNS